MSKWEDILKDKLEGYERTLPAGCLDEFRARRNASSAPMAGPLPARRFPLTWVLAAAVAAGVAAILFLRQPASPGDGIQPIRQVPTPTASIADTTEASEPFPVELLPAKPLIALKSAPKAASFPSEPPTELVTLVESGMPTDETAATHLELEIPVPEEKPEEDSVTVTTIPPPAPDNAGGEPVRMQLEPAAGILAGGGLLFALVTTAIKGSALPATGSGPRGQTGPGTPVYYPEDSFKTRFPFRGGLSVGIPVSERFRLTTGLEYSRYQSNLISYIEGEKKQVSHYLGVPVRLDWMLAGNRRFDVYFGGGIEGGFCIGATLAGERIRKDGFNLSLLGAGGIQFNLNKHLGVYVEPELSWTLPSESRVLQTYRSERPLMFSVTTGLRLNLGNNR